MKGVVFNILEEMVLESHGMMVWNEILDNAQEATGVYTAGKSYPDSHLFELISLISNKLETPVEQLISHFGEFMFKELVKRHPTFTEAEPTLRSFLHSIENVIHAEVKKLYESPNLPQFNYIDKEDGSLIMQYRSERKLCILAEGLIRGASIYYEQPITMKHDVCMHKGHDHCDLEITFLYE